MLRSGLCSTRCGSFSQMIKDIALAVGFGVALGVLMFLGV